MVVPQRVGLSDAIPRLPCCIRSLMNSYRPQRNIIGTDLGPKYTFKETFVSLVESASRAFALAVTMADSMSSTVTLRALAKSLSACLAGSRLVCPDSHLMYVGTDMCARAARVRELSPAEVRRRRKSSGPPLRGDPLRRHSGPRQDDGVFRAVRLSCPAPRVRSARPLRRRSGGPIRAGSSPYGAGRRAGPLGRHPIPLARTTP